MHSNTAQAFHLGIKWNAHVIKVASLCRIILIIAVTVRSARALASIWAARAIGATVSAWLSAALARVLNSRLIAYPSLTISSKTTIRICIVVAPTDRPVFSCASRSYSLTNTVSRTVTTLAIWKAVQAVGAAISHVALHPSLWGYNLNFLFTILPLKPSISILPSPEELPPSISASSMATISVVVQVLNRYVKSRRRFSDEHC